MESWNPVETEPGCLGIIARGKVGTVTVMGRRAKVSELCDPGLLSPRWLSPYSTHLGHRHCRVTGPET